MPKKLQCQAQLDPDRLIDTSIQACVVTTASRRPPSLPRRPPIFQPAFDTTVAHNHAPPRLRWNHISLHLGW